MLSDFLRTAREVSERLPEALKYALLQNDDPHPNSHGIQFFGKTLAAFREEMIDAYGKLPEATRAFLREKKTGISIGRTHDDVNPKTAKEYRNPTQDDTRIHQNQIAGSYYIRENRVIVTQMEYDNGKKPEIGEKPSIAGIVQDRWKIQSLKSLIGILRHEVGHAVDFMAGDMRNTPTFIEAYERDVAALGGEEAARAQGWGYFIQSDKAPSTGRGEVFAEGWACLNGGSRNGKTAFMKAFPRSVGWIADFQSEFDAAYAQGGLEAIETVIEDFKQAPPFGEFLRNVRYRIMEAGNEKLTDEFKEIETLLEAPEFDTRRHNYKRRDILRMIDFKAIADSRPYYVHDLLVDFGKMDQILQQLPFDTSLLREKLQSTEDILVKAHHEMRWQSEKEAGGAKIYEDYARTAENLRPDTPAFEKAISGMLKFAEYLPAAERYDAYNKIADLSPEEGPAREMAVEGMLKYANMQASRMFYGAYGAYANAARYVPLSTPVGEKVVAGMKQGLLRLHIADRQGAFEHMISMINPDASAGVNQIAAAPAEIQAVGAPVDKQPVEAPADKATVKTDTGKNRLKTILRRFSL